MKYDPNKIGSRLKSTLEKYKVLQRFLLVLALVGACMVIGDGILTPALSGLGKLAGSGFPTVNRFDVWITKDVELPVACVILICLFALQHYGTNRVGFLFAPVVITWLLCISSIGLYIIIHWNSHIYIPLSPHYMYVFLKKAQGGGWMDLIFGNGLSLSEGALTVQGINSLLEDTCFSYLKCKVIGAGAQSFTGQRYSNDEQRTLGALDKNHRSYFLC